MKKIIAATALSVILSSAAIPAQAGPYCRPVAEILCEMLPIPL